MVFRTKLQTNSFAQHLNLMRRELWMQYKDFSDEEKVKFFDLDTVFAETFPSFFESADKMEVTIDAEGIEDVIKRLFCDDDTKYGPRNSVTQLLRRLNPTSYQLVVNNLMKFQHVTRFVAQGQSFR